jgi:hypothetical protein
VRARTGPAAAAVALALAVLLSGCTPPPQPEPTPAFSSEAEAFAAAEATYRAYVDALNDVDLSDPETFEEVYAWTTGDANAAIRKSFSEMHADGLTVTGTTLATVVEPLQAGGAGVESVELAVCLDVSGVSLVDATGTSAVDPNRPDVQSMSITLRRDGETSTGWVISRIDGREGGPTCG